MTKGTDRLVQQVKQFVDVRIKVLQSRYGHVAIDLLELPLKVILSPFTLPFDIAGSAPRGFGVPKLVSDLSFGAIFVSISLFLLSLPAPSIIFLSRPAVCWLELLWSVFFWWGDLGGGYNRHIWHRIGVGEKSPLPEVICAVLYNFLSLCAPRTRTSSVGLWSVSRKFSNPLFSR